MYSFQVQKYDDQGGQLYSGFIVQVDGERLSYTHVPNGDSVAALSMTLKLNKGQQVQIENCQTSNVYGTYDYAPWENGQMTRSFFCGTMLYPIFE